MSGGEPLNTSASISASKQKKRPFLSRPGVIATAVAVPVAVIVAVVLAPKDSATTSNPSASVAVAAPPNNPATAPDCTKVIAALPSALAGLAPRKVNPSPASPYVLAWGDPAVVVRCGVARPAALIPGATDELYLVGVYWYQSVDGDTYVFTSVDRSVYIEVRVPKKQVVQPLSAIGEAIAKVLPAVCAVPQTGQPAPAPEQLCTHRS